MTETFAQTEIYSKGNPLLFSERPSDFRKALNGRDLGVISGPKMQTPAIGIQTLRARLAAKVVTELQRYGSKAKLARAAGVQQSRINALVKGEAVSLETLVAFAAYFKIEASLEWWESAEAIRESSESENEADQIRHGSDIQPSSTSAAQLKDGEHAPADDLDARVRQLEEENDYMRSVLADFKQRCVDAQDDLAYSLAYRAGDAPRRNTARPRSVSRQRHNSSAS
jgi:transcriptional regulator with XRE-family HTH domain